MNEQLSTPRNNKELQPKSSYISNAEAFCRSPLAEKEDSISVGNTERPFFPPGKVDHFSQRKKRNLDESESEKARYDTERGMHRKETANVLAGVQHSEYQAVDNISFFWEAERLKIKEYMGDRELHKEILRVLKTCEASHANKNLLHIQNNLNIAEDKEYIDRLREALVDKDCRAIIAQNLKPLLKMRSEKKLTRRDQMGHTVAMSINRQSTLYKKSGNKAITGLSLIKHGKETIMLRQIIRSPNEDEIDIKIVANSRDPAKLQLLLNYVEESPFDQELQISPKEYVLMDQIVTGLAESWFDICHDLASFIMCDDRLYFFVIHDMGTKKPTWKTIKRTMATTQKETATTFVYQVYLKYFDLNTKRIETHDEITLNLHNQLFQIIFVQHNLQCEDLKKIFVSLVHDQSISLRKLWKDGSMQVMTESLNVQIDMPGEQIHSMIYDPRVRENAHYLRHAFEKVDHPLEMNARYLMLTDRYKDQLYVFKVKDLDGKIIEEIELTEEQKGQLLETRKMFTFSFSAYRQVCPTTHELTQNNLQSKHIFELFTGIFGDQITIATMKEGNRYIFLVGDRHNFEMKKVTPITVDLELDLNDNEKESWKEIYLNTIVDQDQITISRRISNMFIMKDSQSIYIDDKIFHMDMLLETDFDLCGPITLISSSERIGEFEKKRRELRGVFGSKQFTDERNLYWDYGRKKSKVALLNLSPDEGGEFEYRPAIQPPNVNIIEHTGDIQLCLLSDDTGQLRFAVSALDKGKMLPGTFIPLQPFGSDETYASLCQSCDSEIIRSEMDHGVQLDCTATRFSVAMIKKYNAMEIVVYEILIKKFQRQSAVKLLSHVYEGEQNEKFIYRASICAMRRIFVQKQINRAKPLIFPLFELQEGRMLRIVGARLQPYGFKHPIMLYNSLKKPCKIDGTLTYSQCYIQKRNYLIAEVKLKPKVIGLACTKYDLFRNRKLQYLLEIFQVQIKNVLNMDLYPEDYLIHIDENAFETCNSNEWFRACNLLCGFSPGELKIDKSRFDLIQEQLSDLQIQDLDTTIESINRFQHSTKQSNLEQAVKFFNSLDFNRFIWDNDYLIREEDFLQYDLNCQSQLVAVYQRCINSEDKDLRHFQQVLELLMQCKMNPQKKRCHMTAILKMSGFDYQEEVSDRQVILQPVVEFLHEQKDTGADQSVGLRMLIDDVSLPRTKKVPHVSTFLPSDNLLMPGGDNYLVDCRESISSLIKKSASGEMQRCSKCQPLNQTIRGQAFKTIMLCTKCEHHLCTRCFESLFKRSSKNDRQDKIFQKCHNFQCDMTLRAENFKTYSREDKILNTKGFEDWNWEQNKQYFIKHSIIDYRPIVYQSFITNCLAVQGEESALFVSEYKFNLLEFAKTNMGLLRQMLWAKVQFSQIQSLSDATQALFKPNTRWHYSASTNMFFFGHVVPIFVQIMVPNDVLNDDFRTTPSAFAIYVASLSIMFTQAYLLEKEYRSFVADGGDASVHFDMQNIGDLTSILYSIGYSIVRIILPYGTYLNPLRYECFIDDECENNQYDASEDGLARQVLVEKMPIIHIIMVCLTMFQSVFFLMINESRAKFIKLFVTALIDMSNFLVINGILITMITLIHHCLGATWDAGGNFEGSTYNVDFYPYLYLPYIWTAIISNIRTSVGDLQPPGYNYWAAHYIYDEKSAPRAFAHVNLIWIVWLIGLLLNVILGLNFLIAIVSETYGEIMDRQEEAIVSSRNALNLEYVKEQCPDSEKDVEFLVMASTIDQQDNEQDEIMQDLKKDIKKIPDFIKKEFRRNHQRNIQQLKLEMKNEIRGVKGDIIQVQETLAKLLVEQQLLSSKTSTPKKDKEKKSGKRIKEKHVKVEEKDETSSTSQLSESEEENKQNDLGKQIETNEERSFVQEK